MAAGWWGGGGGGRGGGGPRRAGIFWRARGAAGWVGMLFGGWISWWSRGALDSGAARAEAGGGEASALALAFHVHRSDFLATRYDWHYPGTCEYMAKVSARLGPTCMGARSSKGNTARCIVARAAAPSPARPRPRTG